MKKFLIPGIVLFCIGNSFSFAAVSPVVQVVSYKEPLGLYFSLLGWGSGSIIDSQWHIITNNHVVDDGAGGISDDFAVCITFDPALPPRCHYTASVIDRDEEADIAILKLDSTDIFGKNINASSLETLNMNMQYVPQARDIVLARGYPWIGSNTITETQWIIAWTAQYNGKTYLKSDTLIWGGNSGGPLIKDGSIIGINTFLIGGGMDPALSYSLLIGESKEFIQKTLLKSNSLQDTHPKFPDFLRSIDSFSKNNTIIDTLITIKLPQKYTINSYIPGVTIDATLSDMQQTSVTSFYFHHLQTPRLKNEQSLKAYLSVETGESDVTLSPTTIGGRQFFKVIPSYEWGEEKTNNYHVYISVVEETHLLFLVLETAIPTKSTIDPIKQSVKNFLDAVSFPQSFVFPKPSDINLSGWIQIRWKGYQAITYDIWEYRGYLSNMLENENDFVMVKNYFDTFGQTVAISVFRNSFETEDDTPEMWLERVIDYNYVKPKWKKMITYQGHTGFLICSDDTILNENGKIEEVVSCETVIFVWEKNDYIISTFMLLPRKLYKDIDRLMIAYLDKVLVIPSTGNTDFTQTKEPALLYADILEQSSAFKELLTLLVEEGILQKRPNFEWENPLLWREYVALYVWAVYHKRMDDTLEPGWKTMKQILSPLPISQESYAEDSDVSLRGIHVLIRLLIAGWSLPKYDADTIGKFINASYDRDGKFKEAWEKITTFEYDHFAQNKPLPKAQYTSKNIVTYNPITGLSQVPIGTGTGSNYFRDAAKDNEIATKIIQCDISAVAYFSAACVEMRKTSVIKMLTYTVLTKWKAIEYISPNIDLSVWVKSKEL